MIQWIKTQVLKFFGSAQNPYYKKVKRILASQKSISVYSRVYFLGGFEYSDSTYSKFKEHIKTGGLKVFFEAVKYNAQGDNVELYLIETEESRYLLSLLDPLELFNGEQILDIIKSPEIKLEDVKYELIYPATAIA